MKGKDIQEVKEEIFKALEGKRIATLEVLLDKAISLDKAVPYSQEHQMYLIGLQDEYYKLTGKFYQNKSKR